jgi:hypothetical protein
MRRYREGVPQSMLYVYEPPLSTNTDDANYGVQGGQTDG